jgi:hypothetical protein
MQAEMQVDASRTRWRTSIGLSCDQHVAVAKLLPSSLRSKYKVITFPATQLAEDASRTFQCL